MILNKIIESVLKQAPDYEEKLYAWRMDFYDQGVITTLYSDEVLDDWLRCQNVKYIIETTSKIFLFCRGEYKWKNKTYDRKFIDSEIRKVKIGELI